MSNELLSAIITVLAVLSIPVVTGWLFWSELETMRNIKPVED